MTDPIRKLIMAHEEAGEIQKLAIEEGMRTMYEDGLRQGRERRHDPGRSAASHNGNLI